MIGQRVAVNGSKYTWRPVTSRVPQWAALRPVLYNTFVSNTKEVMEWAPKDSKLEPWVHWRTELPSRRTWTGWRNRLDGIVQNSTRTNAKSCTWERLTLCNKTRCHWVFGSTSWFLPRVKAELEREVCPGSKEGILGCVSSSTLKELIISL